MTKKELQIENEQLKSLLLSEELGTRSMIGRIIMVMQFLRGSIPANASTIASACGTSTKTIHRDIQFIKNQLKVPVAFNNAKNCYELLGDVKFDWFTKSGEASDIGPLDLKMLIESFHKKGCRHE